MTARLRSLKDLIADECGGTAVEYGMIAGLVIIALLGGLTSVGDANNATYQMLEDELVVN